MREPMTGSDLKFNGTSVQYSMSGREIAMVRCALEFAGNNLRDFCEKSDMDFDKDELEVFSEIFRDAQDLLLLPRIEEIYEAGGRAAAEVRKDREKEE
jgi:hypothetical protein